MPGSSGRMSVPRSRGAACGLLIVLLGIWGGLMPYIGSSFDYTFTPDSTWTWTAGRFWLELLPGLAAVLGGVVLIISGNRLVATLGGWLAAAAGAWFVVGPLVSPLWNTDFIGQPVGDKVDRSVEQIGLFYGLGAAIVFLAAFALGRLAVIAAGDMHLHDRHAVDDAAAASAGKHRLPERTEDDDASAS
jgi:hypothetical protein